VTGLRTGLWIDRETEFPDAAWTLHGTAGLRLPGPEDGGAGPDRIGESRGQRSSGDAAAAPAAVVIAANPVNHVTVPIPPKALADHVSGCAGVRFRIDPDGTPRDVVALTEYPLGYGFAHTAELAVADFRWPARDDRAWRYLIINMHQNGAS
jgi:hypothetical protein